MGVPVSDAFLAAPVRLFGGILFLGSEVVGPLSAPRRPGGCRGAADYFFPAFFLPATVFFLPFLVRALVCVRCPCTGSPRRCRMP